MLAYFFLVAVTIIPFLFSLLYERQREEDFIFIFINSAILLWPLYFIKKHKIYFILLFPVLLLPAIFDFAHIFLYQGRITEETFFIIFDTNPVETFEYLSSNLNFELIFFTLSYIVLVILFWIKILRMPQVKLETSWYKFIILWIILPFIGKLTFSKGDLSETSEAYIRSNHFLSTVDNYLDYKSEMELFKKLGKGMKKDLEVYSKNSAAQTHVLILGESLTKRKMSLYGYHRKTNPELEKLQDEINVFKDVVCSNPPGTMANIKKILTLYNSENKRIDLLSMNIINIMRSAGFKTYWISNQAILGKHDTSTAVFAKLADKYIFTNTTNSTSYDEKVIPHFKRFLKDGHSKKFIVIHLLGSHMQYDKRYPEAFEKFKTLDKKLTRDFHNKRKQSVVNAYDNSILYNDYILARLFAEIESLNEQASLIYISDHGEEVYDFLDLHGHPGTSPTLNMYQIPLLIWSSTIDSFEEHVSKKYVSDDLIHTMLDLYQIEASFFEPEKSIINKAFVEKPRLMGDKLI